MARRRNTVRYRRRRRVRYKLIDRLLLAGIVAGAVYLVVHHLLGASEHAAVLLGVLALGFALGRVVRVPYLRSPVVWRRGRRW
jgi:hypothetical protein